MKYLIPIALTSLIALYTSMTYAQEVQKDSIFVKIEDKLEIKVSIYDYSDLKSTILKDLEELQEILKVTEDIPEDTPYSITYKPNEKLTINTKETVETVIWENGKHMPYKFENKCVIVSDKYQLKAYFNTLEDLTSEDLTAKLSEAVEATITNNNRYSKLFKYSFDKDSLIASENYGIGKRGHTLELTGGVGANLIKNEFVLDLSGQIAFNLNNKDIPKSSYYISYNLLYDFVENSSADLNGFLNLGYRHNLSNSYNDTNWLGLEFGYLVNRNGNLFDEDTFRFGLNWDLGRSISIAPQLYISSEQTFPGLRIGIGF